MHVWHIIDFLNDQYQISMHACLHYCSSNQVKSFFNDWWRRLATSFQSDRIFLDTNLSLEALCGTTGGTYSSRVFRPVMTNDRYFYTI